MLYKNGKPTGLYRTLQTLIPHGFNSAYGKPYYPYDHFLSLSLSSTDVVLPPHNHSETAHETQTTLYHSHPFIFIKAGFSFGFSRATFSHWVFSTSGFSHEAVGHQPPKSFIHFSFHAGAKLSMQAQALPIARRKISTAQQCFASSQQRSLWPHTAPYPECPCVQLMQPFPNNGALTHSPTRTKNNSLHSVKHPFRI